LSATAGRLVALVGAKLPLVIGPSIAGLGFALFALPGTSGSYWTTFFPAVLVLGLGMTISVAPLTTTVMNAVAAGAAGTASGINNAVSRVAALLAVAALGIVMTQFFSGALNRSLASAAASPAAIESVSAQRDKLGAIEISAAATPAEARTLRAAVDEAFVAGFRRVMGVAAALAFAAAAVAWLMIGAVRGAPTGARADPEAP
jgi:hypothetical protein